MTASLQPEAWRFLVLFIFALELEAGTEVYHGRLTAGLEDRAALAQTHSIRARIMRQEAKLTPSPRKVTTEEWAMTPSDPPNRTPLDDGYVAPICAYNTSENGTVAEEADAWNLGRGWESGTPCVESSCYVNTFNDSIIPWCTRANTGLYYHKTGRDDWGYCRLCPGLVTTVTTTLLFEQPPASLQFPQTTPAPVSCRPQPDLSKTAAVVEVTNDREFADLVDFAADGSVLHLDNGRFSPNRTIVVTKRLVIKGNGATNTFLDGSSLDGSGMFSCLAGCDLTFINVTLTSVESGARQFGGFVDVIGAKLTAFGSKFYHSRTAGDAKGFGGAVALTFAGARAFFANCTFEKNFAVKEGGAVWIGSTLPQDNETIEANFIGCTFIDNEAGERGGAVAIAAAGPGVPNASRVVRFSSDNKFLANAAPISSSVSRNDATVLFECPPCSSGDAVTMTGSDTLPSVLPACTRAHPN